MKKILILLLGVGLINCMEQFSAGDRQQVRKQVAQYILSKQNHESIKEEVVNASPVLRRLNAQGVIKDFETNSACVDDNETHIRYRVYLGTKKVEETKLPKN